MRITIRSLLVAIAAFALCLAAIIHPSRPLAQFASSGLPFLGCVALVIAFHTTAAVQSFALTFGIFALAHPFIFPPYNMIDTWILENVVYDGPETLPVGNFDDHGATTIINSSVGLMIAIVSGAIASHLGAQRSGEP